MAGSKIILDVLYILYTYYILIILLRECNGIISMYNNAKIMQKWNVKKAILTKIIVMCSFNILIFNNEIHIII